MKHIKQKQIATDPSNDCINFEYYGESLCDSLNHHYLQPDRNSVGMLMIYLLSVHTTHAFSEAHLGQLCMDKNGMQMFDLCCECVNAFLNSAL